MELTLISSPSAALDAEAVVVLEREGTKRPDLEKHSRLFTARAKLRENFSTSPCFTASQATKRAVF